MANGKSEWGICVTCHEQSLKGSMVEYRHLRVMLEQLQVVRQIVSPHYANLCDVGAIEKRISRQFSLIRR